MKENNKKEKDVKKVEKKKTSENKESQEKEPNKFIQIIKKKWLVNGTKTFLLVAIIVAIFIAINMFMQSLELTPIDVSKDQINTLSDEAKDKVKDINKDVKIYFVGYGDDDSTLSLAKQFKNVNEKITAEAIDVTARPDIANKYGIESGTQGIIVECGEKSKVLSASDLVTYDKTTYETISVADEKLTSAIVSVTTDTIPKVYFLNGYSDFKLDSNMNYLNAYLSNEINEVKTLDLLSAGSVPTDCDTLVITTPSKDFDDVATNAIINYINAGGNILWLNGAKSNPLDTPNVNKVLAMYGVNPFDVGVIRETNSSKMASNQPDIIVPDMTYSQVTKDLQTTTGVLFINATKINFADETALEGLNVTKTEMLNASETSYFRSNLSNNSNARADGESDGPFVIGAELDKQITAANEENGTSEVTSKLIIYGENYFASDYSLGSSSNSYSYGAIQYAYNKDLILNSIAYLVDRQEDITTRKSTGTVTYTATQEQNTIIQVAIFTVPAIIIAAGIIVWQVRRRRK